MRSPHFEVMDRLRSMGINKSQVAAKMRLPLDEVERLFAQPELGIWWLTRICDAAGIKTADLIKP